MDLTGWGRIATVGDVEQQIDDFEHGIDIDDAGILAGQTITVPNAFAWERLGPLPPASDHFSLILPPLFGKGRVNKALVLFTAQIQKLTASRSPNSDSLKFRLVSTELDAFNLVQVGAQISDQFPTVVIPALRVPQVYVAHLAFDRTHLPNDRNANFVMIQAWGQQGGAQFRIANAQFTLLEIV